MAGLKVRSPNYTFSRLATVHKNVMSGYMTPSFCGKYSGFLANNCDAKYLSFLKQSVTSAKCAAVRVQLSISQLCQHGLRCEVHHRCSLSLHVLQFTAVLQTYIGISINAVYRVLQPQQLQKLDPGLWYLPVCWH